MEQATTEVKLRLEKEILDMKREYKYAHENLSRIKEETNEILAVKDRTVKDVEEKRRELVSILNDISNEKLMWALNKQKDIDELASKRADADNVIKWKGDLNKKEEEIRQIEANDIKVRNETRQLELKIEQKSVELENREKQIVVLQKALEEERKLMEKDKKQFKDKIAKVLSEVNEL